MNFFTNILDIMSDLEELKKKVYLDTPDVFVDLSDKIDNKEFDEMVLFFATKYDYLSIVKFIISNNLVNLEGVSKNTQFKTIKDHIIEASKQFKAKAVNDFLTNLNEEELKKDNLEASIEEGLESFIKLFDDKLTDLCSQIDNLCNDNAPDADEDTADINEDVEKSNENIEITDEAKADIENIEITDEAETNTENIEITDEAEADTENIEITDEADCQSSTKEMKKEQPEEKLSGYEPKFICPNCSCNILKEGYSVPEITSYKYSKEENKIVKVSTEQSNSVTCNKCKYTIEQLNPLFLENISTVQNCRNCGKDLTTSGITTKLQSEYDKESNCFVASKKTYHCGECNHELSEYQVSYFSL